MNAEKIITELQEEDFDIIDASNDKRQVYECGKDNNRIARGTARTDQGRGGSVLGGDLQTGKVKKDECNNSNTR